MLVPPCKGCENRSCGCHSSCEGYINYRKEKDRINEIRHKSVEVKDAFFDIALKNRRRRY